MMGVLQPMLTLSTTRNSSLHKLLNLARIKNNCVCNNRSTKCPVHPPPFFSPGNVTKSGIGRYLVLDGSDVNGTARGDKSNFFFCWHLFLLNPLNCVNMGILSRTTRLVSDSGYCCSPTSVLLTMDVPTKAVHDYFCRVCQGRPLPSIYCRSGRRSRPTSCAIWATQGGTNFCCCNLRCGTVQFLRKCHTASPHVFTVTVYGPDVLFLVFSLWPRILRTAHKPQNERPTRLCVLKVVVAPRFTIGSGTRV